MIDLKIKLVCERARWLLAFEGFSAARVLAFLQKQWGALLHAMRFHSSEVWVKANSRLSPF